MLDAPRARARMIPVLAALALAATTSACSLFNREPTGTADQVDESLSGGLKPCVSWFDRDIQAVSMSADGARVAYISSRKPDGVAEDAWRSGDRAVFVRDIDPDTGAASTRYIASTWSATDELPEYATRPPDDKAPERPVLLAEQLADLALSSDGKRIVIGVTREALAGGLAKLYVGAVPEDASTTLAPGDEGGLTVVPLNSYRGDEAVLRFQLSPDGAKVAAAVGGRGELRVYDLDANALSVYSLGQDNEIEVTNELPAPSTSLAVDRSPAVLTGGSAFAWSPDGSEVALARSIPVSTHVVQVLDVAGGDLTTVRRFVNTTVPHVAWAQDGGSLFVMTTRLGEGEQFGNTDVRRIAAAADGDEIGSGMTIARAPEHLNWRTEPNYLQSLGNDRSFVFNWEGWLFRLDLPGEGGGDPSYIKLTPLDAGMALDSRPVNVSASADRAVFLLRDGSVRRVGVRTHVSADRCPESPTPVPTAEDGAEGG